MSVFVSVLSMFRLWLIVIVSYNNLASPEDSRIWKETRFQIGSLWNSQECCAVPASKFYLHFNGSQDIPLQDQAVQEQKLCLMYIKYNHHSDCTFR